MTINDWIQVAAAAATIILLVAAGVTDITRYRIPNVIVYAIAAAFAAGAVFNLSWPAVAWPVLAAAVMFALGAGLFALRVFGGGDVKLIAAMALWTGFADLMRFLLVMSIAGGLLGMVWIVRRRSQQPAMASETASSADSPASDAPPQPKVPNRIPYGVAIAIAGLDFFFTSAHSPLAPLLPWMQ